MFAASRNGNWDVHWLDYETGDDLPLTTHPADDQDPDITYSAKGSVVFASNRDGGDHEIYVMEHDGSAPRRLTAVAGADRHPQWSPRRTHIAFVSERDGNQELYVMNADGSGQVRLTEYPGPDVDPAWASNVRLPSGDTDLGTDIAFASRRDGNLDVYVVRPDGSSLRRLTDSAAGDRAPQWSPDGTRIAFVSERDGNPEIYVMYADGSGQTRLTTDPGDDNGPAWSANGDRIAFSGDRAGVRRSYSMRPDGTDQVLSRHQTE